MCVEVDMKGHEATPIANASSSANATHEKQNKHSISYSLSRFAHVASQLHERYRRHLKSKEKLLVALYATTSSSKIRSSASRPFL